MGRTSQTSDERVNAVPTGKVKWYDVEKGFGFLSQEEGEDVYVRASALPEGVEGLKAGQKVEFGMAAGRRGPQALSLKVLEPARHCAAHLRSDVSRLYASTHRTNCTAWSKT